VTGFTFTTFGPPPIMIAEVTDAAIADVGALKVTDGGRYIA